MWVFGVWCNSYRIVVVLQCMECNCKHIQLAQHIRMQITMNRSTRPVALMSQSNTHRTERQNLIGATHSRRVHFAEAMVLRCAVAAASAGARSNRTEWSASSAGCGVRWSVAGACRSWHHAAIRRVRNGLPARPYAEVNVCCTAQPNASVDGASPWPAIVSPSREIP
jgi:hypothetical protein